MSDQVEIAGIGLLVVIVQGIFALLNQRNHNSTQASIETVRQDVNGKMSQMLTSAEAKGHADEKLNPS